MPASGFRVRAFGAPRNDNGEVFQQPASGRFGRNGEPTILVLPVRIELTTSPLPRGCSTTELRQQDRSPPPLMAGAPETATGGLAAQERARHPKSAALVGALASHRRARALSAALSGPAAGPIGRDMDGDRRNASKNPARLARGERLAAALRANAKRRKAQARARAQAETAHAGAAHDSAGFMKEIATKPKG